MSSKNTNTVPEWFCQNRECLTMTAWSWTAAACHATWMCFCCNGTSFCRSPCGAVVYICSAPCRIPVAFLGKPKTPTTYRFQRFVFFAGGLVGAFVDSCQLGCGLCGYPCKPDALQKCCGSEICCGLNYLWNSQPASVSAEDCCFIRYRKDTLPINNAIQFCHACCCLTCGVDVDNPPPIPNKYSAVDICSCSRPWPSATVIPSN